MSGSSGNNMGLQGLTQQGQISNHIKQFMPGRLIAVVKFEVIQYAILHHINPGFLKKVCEAVEILLRNYPVHKHYGQVFHCPAQTR